jgi:ankyrin repeat protein
LDSVTQDGNTALHLAVKRQSGDLVKILMMHNANPNLENESNQTPFHEALEGGHDEIIQILVENKADVNTRDKVH